MISILRSASVSLLILLSVSCASAPKVEQPAESVEAAVAEKSDYAKLITDEAETDEGVFTVHRVEDKLYFEIPNELLGRDMLVVSRIARAPTGLAGGFIVAGHKTGEQVLRFERVDDRVLLRKVSFRNIADDDAAISSSVVNNNFFPILASFDVKAEGPAPADEDEEGAEEDEGDEHDDDAGAHESDDADDAGDEDGDEDDDADDEHETTTVLIEVTDLFLKDAPALSGMGKSLRDAHKVGGLDAKRSFLNYARAFPQNVDVRYTLTYSASAPPTDAGTKTLSMEMHQSMILLPEEPMRLRISDDRVGWFTTSRTNYGLDAQKSATEEFIQRWRLEPSDPQAYARGELVEPLKPIVYYLDPATPTKWRENVRQGVLDWQPAFEAAGFKNAILCLDAPTAEEDPEFSGEDVRHSMVRWAATTTRNAMGPSVTDPRSGEIIESDIVWYHNHMRSYRNRLLLETGAANPLARSLPIDDGLLGEALRQVIAHEVGHALGLPHNMIASSSYPTESLRDPAFARERGVSATIMDYARQNYVAQPGDGLVGADFIRKIGAYDHYAIEWGYRVYPNAATPADEKSALDAMILAKVDDPMYRFGSSNGVDPRAQTEDLGDDPVASSGYGLANLQAVAPRLIAWTSKPGEDYADLEELYGELVGQYSRYMGHVVTVIGGAYSDLKTSDQPGRLHSWVQAEDQREAMAFLATNVFATPGWLLNPEILRRIDHSGDVDRISGLQASFLRRVLDPGRMQRLVEAELELGDAAYTLPEMLADVRAAVWANTSSADTSDAFSRALQRAHLDRLEQLMTEDLSSFSTSVDTARSDIPALARHELRAILESTDDLLADTRGNVAASAHAHDVKARIEAFFEGRVVQ